MKEVGHSQRWICVGERGGLRKSRRWWWLLDVGFWRHSWRIGSYKSVWDVCRCLPASLGTVKNTSKADRPVPVKIHSLLRHFQRVH